jgi:hypothetical protein
MERIKERQVRNGLSYKLIDRTELVALFELRLSPGELVGYEVSRINIQEPLTMPSGHNYPNKEVITNNGEFGADGSKSFFPMDLPRAELYLLEFNDRLKREQKIKEETVWLSDFSHDLP